MSGMQRGAGRRAWFPLLASVVLAGAAGQLPAAPGTLPAAAGQLPAAAGVPLGDRVLGTIELPRRVMANGQALSPGAYSVHLTTRTASPEPTGASASLERWVEFRQGDAVVGQEVATILPAAEIADVAKSAPPASGSSRVEVLREGDYVRIWINRNGTHYLLHLPVGRR